MLLDGKKLADRILDDLKKDIGRLSKKIKMAVILIGDDPSSLSFIKEKQKAAEGIGIGFKLYRFDSKINTDELQKEVKKITKSKSITGVVIQLPLPFHIDKYCILNTVPSKKDVDILSSQNLGGFYQGTSLISPPTASGIVKLLEEYGIKVKGRKVVIIGFGDLVGKPLAILMLRAGANLTVCRRSTKYLKKESLGADILISATGKPHLITEDMIRRGAVVIDAGFGMKKGKIVGDVDFEKVKNKAGYISPVPGGVGPMTVAMLMSNLVKLKAQSEKRKTTTQNLK